tara:strand:- start:210 stop:515 length:306 start_codon:yes stop_codon:yes gene_type:complete
MKTLFFEYTTAAFPFYDEGRKLFSQVTVEDDMDDDCILETIFAWCNHGSGRECQAFLDAKMRSLSVGDFVTIGTCFSDARKYRCDSQGWTEFLPIGNPTFL